MIIRKIQYNISYAHILTFKDDYKKITSPYFGWNKVRYSIEQMNTIHESLRLIFSDFNTVMHFRKDGITIMFEGNETDFTGDNSLVKEFFVMYDSITRLECFSRTTRQDIILYAVDPSKPVNNEDFLKNNPIPEKLKEFACTYHYHYNTFDIHLTFGNYLFTDIEKYDLSPFKTKHNEDLFGSENGRMCEVRLVSEDNKPSLSHLKKMIHNANKHIQLFK